MLALRVMEGSYISRGTGFPLSALIITTGKGEAARLADFRCFQSPAVQALVLRSLEMKHSKVHHHSVHINYCCVIWVFKDF